MQPREETPNTTPAASSHSSDFTFHDETPIWPDNKESNSPIPEKKRKVETDVSEDNEEGISEEIEEDISEDNDNNKGTQTLITGDFTLLVDTSKNLYTS